MTAALSSTAALRSQLPLSWLLLAATSLGCGSVVAEMNAAAVLLGFPQFVAE